MCINLNNTIIKIDTAPTVRQAVQPAVNVASHFSSRQPCEVGSITSLTSEVQGGDVACPRSHSWKMVGFRIQTQAVRFGSLSSKQDHGGGHSRLTVFAVSAYHPNVLSGGGGVDRLGVCCA